MQALDLAVRKAQATAEPQAGGCCKARAPLERQEQHELQRLSVSRASGGARNVLIAETAAQICFNLSF